MMYEYYLPFMKRVAVIQINCRDSNDIILDSITGIHYGNLIGFHIILETLDYYNFLYTLP